MNKKLLLGSLFVLILILLMPSISAVQHMTVEGEIKQDIKEKFDSISFKSIKDNIVFEEIKYALLYNFVFFIYKLYLVRILIHILIGISIIIWVYSEEHTKMIEYLGFILCAIVILRMMRLEGSFILWESFWMNMSDYFGWNWDF